MIRFKLNQETTEILEKLTKIYEFRYETVTMRIAFALSLSNDKYYSNEEQISGNDGKEFSPTSNVFGRYIDDIDNESIYYAVLCQHYNQKLTSADFIRLYKLHLSHGLAQWLEKIKMTDTVSGGHVKYLAKIFNKGLSQKPVFVHTASTETKIEVAEFKSLLKFDLGEFSDGSKVEIRLNDLREFDNRNIAIAGMAGSGKTQLIKDVLYQISQKTNNELKFIFFDYKGEGDSGSLSTFLESTKCKFVDIIKDGGLDFNPLSVIKTDQNHRLFSINLFVETIATFTPNIGINQKSILKGILTELFDSIDGNRTPTINELFSSVNEFYEKNSKKKDSLYAGIEDLNSNVFNCDFSKKSIFDESLYLNLPQELSDTLRQLIVFLILRYLVSFFSSTNDCTPVDSIFPLRYVIVIDEAHIYLKNKNASKALEDMLRLLRSKGVVIIMLSQGAEDYKTKNFDFVSQVKIPICLNINNKDYKVIEHFLGTPKSTFQLQEAIDELAPGKGIINIKEPMCFKLAQWWQTEKSLS